MHQGQRFSPRGLLHDHLDGSAAMMDVMPELYRLAGKPYPFASEDECRRFFDNPYGDIVAKFGVVTGVLQSRDALQLAAGAYVRRRAREGYAYVEAKFAPQYHCAGGLTMKEVVTIMTEALVACGRAHGLAVLPVVCIGREASPEEGVAIARLALEASFEVALDLVCDEANHPPEKHKPAFDLTRNRIRRDGHAGEWVLPEPAKTYRQRLLANVATAVRVLNVDGLGHALPLIDDLELHGGELVREIVDRDIRVTSCPASYVQTGLIAGVTALGLDRLLDAGVNLTVNPDDDLFLPNMQEVGRLLRDGAGLSRRHLAQLEENVYRGAFHSAIRSFRKA